MLGENVNLKLIHEPFLAKFVIIHDQKLGSINRLHVAGEPSKQPVMLIDPAINQKDLTHDLLQVYLCVVAKFVLNQALLLEFLFVKLSDDTILELLHLIQLGLYLLHYHFVFDSFQQLEILFNLLTEFLQGFI
jgi:hypothetical protein